MTFRFQMPVTSVTSVCPSRSARPSRFSTRLNSSGGFLLLLNSSCEFFSLCLSSPHSLLASRCLISKTRDSAGRRVPFICSLFFLPFVFLFPPSSPSLHNCLATVSPFSTFHRRRRSLRSSFASSFLLLRPFFFVFLSIFLFMIATPPPSPT